MSTMLPRALLSLVLALLTLALSDAGGGRPAWDTPRAAAESPISPDDEAWIKTASIRADLDGDAQRVRLESCLRVRIGAGVGRFPALRDCYARVLSTPSGDTDALEELGETATESTLISERARLIAARTAQLLEALRLWGATPEQIAALRGPLTACLEAWGSVEAVVSHTDENGNETLSLSESIVDWCAEDLPDFAQLRRKQPTIRSLGCPSEVFQGRPFSCAPVIEGDATIFSWRISGGTSTEGRSGSMTPGAPGPATVNLLACNGEPDPGTAGNCTELDQPVTVEPSPPVVGAPGCPGTAPLNTAITCAPTGVSNTGPATAWGWTATGASIANDSAPTATVTFTAGGVQTVTVIACNSARSCSAPVEQRVMVGPPQATAAASITVTPASVSAGQTIRYCYTLPGPGAVGFAISFAGGGGQTLLDGQDDGRGDCLTATVQVPAGQMPAMGCVVMRYTAGGRSGTEQACFTIVASATPTPTPAPTPRPSTSPSNPVDLSGTYVATSGLKVQLGIITFVAQSSQWAPDDVPETLTRGEIRLTVRADGLVTGGTITLDATRPGGRTAHFDGTVTANRPTVFPLRANSSIPDDPAREWGVVTFPGRVKVCKGGSCEEANRELKLSYIFVFRDGRPTGEIVICGDRDVINGPGDCTAHSLGTLRRQ